MVFSDRPPVSTDSLLYPNAFLVITSVRCGRFFGQKVPSNFHAWVPTYSAREYSNIIFSVSIFGMYRYLLTYLPSERSAYKI